MTKARHPKKDQRELLFVFPPSSQMKTQLDERNETVAVAKTVLKKDEIDTLRIKLISELREYGC